MTPEQERINLLAAKLEVLLKKHELFSTEMTQLKRELNELKEKPTLRFEAEIKPVITAPPIEKVTVREEPIAVVNYALEAPKKKKVDPKNDEEFFEKKTSKTPTFEVNKSGLEKFIGENLFSKIGIIITIIGVVIGAKYVIDHQLISPITRIILGYLVGFGLLAFAIKLKKNYLNFSAVLLSGAMAINYFLTFAAYNYYQLFPQLVTFLIMVIFTVFTVFAALKYDKPIIAHFGLVGAYTIPFLLSDGTGRVAVMFTYMTLVNFGILIISLKKYWKSLYFVSFSITWLIYGIWFITSYSPQQHFVLGLTFLSVFFGLFYATFLLYKLYNKEKYSYTDIVLLMSNSFIFFGFGYTIFINNAITNHFLGLFTLGNALLHFLMGYYVSKKELGDKNIFYLIIALVLIFITIAIPIQFEGNWVTLIWSAEAAILFWIGRSKSIAMYEYMSFPVMFIALASITNYWQINYNPYKLSTSMLFFNPVFMTSLLFTSSFGFITFTLQKYRSAIKIQDIDNTLKELLSIFAPAVFILGLYLSFGLEIINYWNQIKLQSNFALFHNALIPPVSYIPHLTSVWIMGYSLVFVILLGLFNFYYLKRLLLSYVVMVLSLITLVIFLSIGMPTFSILRDQYYSLSGAQNELSVFNFLYFRYLSIGLSFAVVWMLFRYSKASFIGLNLSRAFDAVLHSCILTFASFEIVDDLKYSVLNPQYGLSILFGLYALMLILMGIFKKNKNHLRYGGIVLFFATLVKLFFVDIVHLDTIPKTIIFLVLGVVLLIISFLYNKYKHLIAESDDTKLL